MSDIRKDAAIHVLVQAAEIFSDKDDLRQDWWETSNVSFNQAIAKMEFMIIGYYSHDINARQYKLDAISAIRHADKQYHSDVAARQHVKSALNVNSMDAMYQQKYINEPMAYFVNRLINLLNYAQKVLPGQDFKEVDDAVFCLLTSNME